MLKRNNVIYVIQPKVPKRFPIDGARLAGIVLSAFFVGACARLLWFLIAD